MKRIIVCIAAVLLMLSCSDRKVCPDLEAGFMDPPHESRPMALWHWMNGNVTKDGIKKDLQWMHDIGLSGFFLFDAAYSTPQVVDTLLPYMGEGWKDAFRYAVALADSLGLEVGIASSPGWSLTGGPWVSEDDAQKKLVWSTTPVRGHFHGALPLPWKTVPSGLFHAVPEQDGIVRDYLKDIRVLAVRQGPDPSVEDISSSYQDGILDWTAPEGEWNVYRFAYTLIGTTNGPAPPEATGLEVDKLDGGAVRRYWENYLGLYEEALGRKLGPGTISNIDIDSYESGKGTWTLHMEEEFEQRRGYSMALWLPALAGELIGTDEERERFLFDWRQTLGELLAENHYDLATEIFHSHGIKRYSESHEERRSFTGDGMMVKRTADVPQGAFWVRFRAGVYATMPHMEADLRESSSVAHIYGQNICAAEAFTTNGRPGKWDGWWAYQCHPGKLKPVADAAMAEGLNWFVIHTSVHQPSEKCKPGLGLGPYGQWFNRFDTWASEARPWIDYISRSCFMLSQGRFVADIAYLYGEDTNPTARFSQERPGIPAGWNYDFVNGDALVNALGIKDGSIVSESGASYRMLVIDSQIERMSDAVAARIDAIREAGIPVCDLRKGGNILSVLEEEGIRADVVNVPDSVAFVHRKLPGGEIYWIANICSRPRNITLGFRDCMSEGRGRDILEPKVWRADRGTIEDVPYRVEEGRLFVDLDMERDDAVFVVLQGKAKKESIRKETFVTEEIMSLSSWDVRFVPAIEPEKEADCHFDSLPAWNESGDPNLRFFSGTATYRTSFRWSPDHGQAGVILDLGRVFNMAHVYLNGKDLGLLWKEPYKTDITEALVDGENTLEIKVTNSWGNRLIGDSSLPKEERATMTSWEFYSPDDPLPTSGLLGPVRILTRTFAERWSEEKANEWYASQPWPVGCVYMPSYGGTPVEIWGKEYFKPEVVDSELALAEDLGFNAIRLFLCDVVWQEDPKGFMERLEETVRLADKHGMRILMTFFTNGGTIKNPYTGPQPQPVPGVHNSVWMSSPGKDVVNNPEKWPVIERYLKQVMKRYRNDPRILAWCLYNEPEHTDGFNTLSFIKEVYRWAREVNPSQPLTSPMCALPDARSYNKPISDFICANSDIISFHCYDDIDRTRQFVDYALQFGRPVLCSEWMARTRGSDYPSILPLFKEKKIGSFSYGLVNGKQQCQYPWNKMVDGKPVPFTEEPELWFHDLFRPDHSPYDAEEIRFIKEYLGAGAPKE